MKVDKVLGLWVCNKFRIRPQRFISEIADVHSHKVATFVFLLVIWLPKELHIFPYGPLIKLIWETAGQWNWLKKAEESFLPPFTFSIKYKQYLKSKKIKRRKESSAAYI